MFKFKQCTKCGSKNKKHHEHCTKCGSPLENILKTSTKSLVMFLVAFLLLGGTATYASYGFYKSKTNNPINQNTVQEKQVDITANETTETPAVSETKQETSSSQDTKTTPVPKKSTTVATPAPTTSPTTTPTPASTPASTVPKLDEQTRIRLLASLNQWEKVPYFDWVLHPEDSNYCSADMDVVMDIRNTYDYFTISNDFADISKARDDVWRKGVGIEMNGVVTTRNKICYSANEAEFNANIEAFRIVLYDYAQLLNIYDQKIKEHSL